MSIEMFTPVVPDQLQPLTSSLLVEDAYDAFYGRTDEVLAGMPEPFRVALPGPGGRFGGGVVLGPKNGEVDESRSIILATQYLQDWKPYMYVMCELTRQIVAPNSRMLVLPNNTRQQTYYDFSKEDIQRIDSGDMTPFYDMMVRTVEAVQTKGIMQLGHVAATGSSQAGLTVLGMASKNSDKFNIAVVNADEAPTKERPGKLQKDFFKSGTALGHRASARDAKLPVMNELTTWQKLIPDYARAMKESKSPLGTALRHAMEKPDFAELVRTVLRRSPSTAIKIGSIAGSLLTRFEDIPEDPRILRRHYTGAGAHKHATLNNPFFVALATVEAILWQQEVSRTA